jgi:hypothetical protein
LNARYTDAAGSEVQVKKMVEEALAKHGLKSASQRAKMKAQLYEEMEEALEEQVRATTLSAMREWSCATERVARQSVGCGSE